MLDANAKVAAERSAESDILFKARGIIRRSAKDPDSVEFRNTAVRNVSGARVVCGEFNAKNSFGTMAGFTHFISLGSIQTTTVNGQASDFAKDWKKYCAANK